MRCSTAERFLSRKLDNQLKPQQAQALDLHLQSCSSCREIDVHNQAIKQAFINDNPSPFPEWLHHRIIHNLPQAPHRSFAERWKLGYATATLAVLFSLYAGTWVGIQSFALSSETNVTSSTELSTQSSFGQISLLETYDE